MNVSQTPLSSLSTPAGDVLQRERDLSSADIKSLLKRNVVRFVVAEVGMPLRWISEEERFRFWKSEALAHIATDQKRCLEDYPDEYFYTASLWRSDSEGGVIIALEKHH